MEILQQVPLTRKIIFKEKKMTKYQVIRCPQCGAEYLPGEIYLPKYFLGQPKNISKDFQGMIVDAEGLPQDLTETFTCNKCATLFEVKANIDYKTKILFNRTEKYTQKI